MVLPCVPATPSTQRPCNTFSANHCGPDTYGKPRFNTASITSIPRFATLPITYTSAGKASNCAASNPSCTPMPKASNWVLIGGYILASQPVTLKPASLAIAAKPPINVPPIPII